ncbi:hypothetical protein PAHAL_2G475600 [Panicum hallii]|uniref:Uncharacterized protein n=1 Tax=Panicum hallii TaxID=206008 RepID=A0A2S3H326_9POAL|nr:hypothetical protein PAHAL_2G475600 [Panicum hallii]
MGFSQGVHGEVRIPFHFNWTQGNSKEKQRGSPAEQARLSQHYRTKSISLTSTHWFITTNSPSTVSCH